MTEQEKYAMDQLLKCLEMQIGIKDNRINKCRERMDSDYLYYFAWEGKELFKAHYMAARYRELHEFVKRAGGLQQVQEYLRQEREKCIGTLLDEEIYTHYTEDIFNLAHSYKMECIQQLVKDYNGFGKILSMKPPREEVKTGKTPDIKERSNRLKI